MMGSLTISITGRCYVHVDQKLAQEEDPIGVFMPRNNLGEKYSHLPRLVAPTSSFSNGSGDVHVIHDGTANPLAVLHFEKVLECGRGSLTPSYGENPTAPSVSLYAIPRLGDLGLESPYLSKKGCTAWVDLCLGGKGSFTSKRPAGRWKFPASKEYDKKNKYHELHEILVWSCDDVASVAVGCNGRSYTLSCGSHLEISLTNLPSEGPLDSGPGFHALERYKKIVREDGNFEQPDPCTSTSTAHGGACPPFSK